MCCAFNYRKINEGERVNAKEQAKKAEEEYLKKENTL